MKKAYDEVIRQHYQKVAQEHGLASTSTMADEITRRLETEAIIAFVRHCLKLRQASGLSDPCTITDVGCGNGYTLEVLSQQFDHHQFFGIEQSDHLRALAVKRFENNKKVKILAGDVRETEFHQQNSSDILICQRVLINLLNHDDQQAALKNIIHAVNSSHQKCRGKLIFIEAFSSALSRLNDARSEFDLEPIPPAHHNLYLPDNFFEIPMLRCLNTTSDFPASNFLSTHYFVTRVLHPILTSNKPFRRNSEFVRFFSEALKQNVGDYSPVKLLVFEKVS